MIKVNVMKRNPDTHEQFPWGEWKFSTMSAAQAFIQGVAVSDEDNKYVCEIEGGE
jgi:hypothetical protein